MRKYIVAVAVILVLTALACNSEDTGGEDPAPQMRATPLAAATPLPAPTASLPAMPAGSSTKVLPPLEAPDAPQPPALPQVSIEYGGSVHHGRQGSYCWPVTANSSVCVDKIGWEDFESATAISVKRGDELSFVVTTDESSRGEVEVQVYTVGETEPFLMPGDQVYSSPAGEGTTLDLEPGVYFLNAFYRSDLGDASYGFKLEMAD